MNPNVLTLISALRSWSDGQKYVFIDSDLYTSEVSDVLQDMRHREKAIQEYTVITSYGRLMEWTKHYHSSHGCLIVVSNRDYADDMQKIRPDLEIRKVQLEKQQNGHSTTREASNA